MAQTAVKDVVIWTKHIHGSDEVRDRVATLRGGETIELLIDGWRGPWCRMNDGGDGRPTLGIRPIGRTKAFWSELYTARRGDLVRIELPDAGPSTQPTMSPATPVNNFRAAARAALLRGLSGFRGEGGKRDRDDLHDRSLDREGL